MEGRRTKGRKRTSILEELMSDGYEKMKRSAQNNDTWMEWVPWTYPEESTDVCILVFQSFLF